MMEYSTWVNTSLDLNLDPSPQIIEAPKSEKTRDFEGLEVIKGTTVKEETMELALVEELNRMRVENKRLTDMLAVLCEKYNALFHHFGDLKCKESISNSSKKRRIDSEDYSINRISPSNYMNGESSSSDEESSRRPMNHHGNINTKVSNFRVRTDPSDTSLVVKDGYQWRKYGQKVTRDNPSPRAYFKCSYAPSCPVKKKVQRSVEDPSILVATYEGNHNHIQPAASSATVRPSTSSVATLDLVQSSGIKGNDHANDKSPAVLEGIDHILVQKMASSLTRDPNFTTALAVAIQGRFLNQARMPINE
ncbi:WRKY transcription factor 18-like [Tripterygium wilfordii]|uniref:WRKY transcription factor 18-like n=1 Tax=Tripterygium wilfordii TaxID=458696 RepID=A0A7J7DPV5_TRIWF|nr:WRKY transcription factor 18-like [Tripterygium wilfordii]KAF5748126.1 WRKY transcription factor 18-like [Tripterygium wilfordii]